MTAFNEVTRLLQVYFDALYECDLEKLAVAFHPRAIYATADETPLLHRTMDTYFAVVAKREPPAARGDIRRDAIDAIEFAGPNLAFARVRCAFGGKQFVDFLTLVRNENRWKIMAKIFHIAGEDPPAPKGE